MRTTLAILSCSLLLGCYCPSQYPLKPGEKIIFNTPERANEYRLRSGNDFGATNRVVEITRPCSVTTE